MDHEKVIQQMGVAVIEDFSSTIDIERRQSNNTVLSSQSFEDRDVCTNKL